MLACRCAVRFVAVLFNVQAPQRSGTFPLEKKRPPQFPKVCMFTSAPRPLVTRMCTTIHSYVHNHTGGGRSALECVRHQSMGEARPRREDQKGALTPCMYACMHAHVGVCISTKMMLLGRMLPCDGSSSCKPVLSLGTSDSEPCTNKIK
jgi:hypothetical protein